MNAKTMKAVLEHLDAKTTEICTLKDKVRRYEDKLTEWKTMIGCGNLTPAQTEEAIKRMSFERTTLETNYKQHVELVNALAACPLPRDAAESNQAYALRVGEALKDAKLQWEHDQRRIAQLEKRESELNALQQIVETRDAQIAQLEEAASSLVSALTLLGTMHDGELANEFVSRMADEKKRVTLQLDLIAKVIEQLPDSMRMQHGETYEPFLRRIQKSYVANEATIASHEATIESLKNRDAELLALYDVIENLRGLPMQPEEKYSEYLKRMAADRMRLVDMLAGSFTAGYVSTLVRERDDAHAATEKAQRELAEAISDNAKQRELDRVISEATLRTALLVIKCLYSCDGLRAIIDASDWGDECQRVIDMAKGATDDDDLILEADFSEKWDALISDLLKRGAMLATENTDLRNRLGSVSRLEGELSLHLQIIARLMMQPGTDKVFDLDWNASARKVLIDARAMCNVVNKEQA